MAADDKKKRQPQDGGQGDRQGAARPGAGSGAPPAQPGKPGAAVAAAGNAPPAQPGKPGAVVAAGGGSAPPAQPGKLGAVASATGPRGGEHEFQGNPRSGCIIWIVFLCGVAVLTWSYFATLNRVVRAPGAFAPVSNTQIVQNLEGGIITELLVRAGDSVQEGQLLLRLDRTRFASSVGELDQEITALQLRRARIKAELEEADEVTFPANISAGQSNLVETERDLFLARRTAYRSRTRNLGEMIRLKSQEISMLEPLVESGAVPELQLVQARLSRTELEAEERHYVTEHEHQLAMDLAEAVTRLSQLDQTMTAARDRLVRTEVLAPSDGVVNRVFFTTVGAVVSPGEAILEITPSAEDLQVEARVATEDIGFVATGMDATLKVTAYDFAIHGTLLGNVTRVSADTVPSEDDPNAPPAFIAIIKLKPDSLEDWLGRDLEVRPGMIVEAELQAGETRILEYIARPILRARDALGEV